MTTTANQSLVDSQFSVSTKQFLAVLSERDQAGLYCYLDAEKMKSLESILGALAEDDLHAQLPKITDIIADNFGRTLPPRGAINDKADSLTRLGSTLKGMSDGARKLSDLNEAEWLAHVLEIESDKANKKAMLLRGWFPKR